MLRMHKTSQKARRFRGFTLIELLVVIAIIALLVSILLPSLKKAKDLAKALVCMANVKNISTALFIYTEDYDGWAPKDYENIGWAWQGWANVLSQLDYTPDGQALLDAPPLGPYLCTTQPNPEMKWGSYSDGFPAVGWTFGFSFGNLWMATHYAFLDAFCLYADGTGVRTIRISETTKSPSDVFMLGGANDVTNSRMHQPMKYTRADFRPLVLRHGNMDECNMVFADGHTVALPAEDGEYDIGYWTPQD